MADQNDPKFSALTHFAADGTRLRTRLTCHCGYIREFATPPAGHWVEHICQGCLAEYVVTTPNRPGEAPVFERKTPPRRSSPLHQMEFVPTAFSDNELVRASMGLTDEKVRQYGNAFAEREQERVQGEQAVHRIVAALQRNQQLAKYMANTLNATGVLTRGSTGATGPMGPKGDMPTDDIILAAFRAHLPEIVAEIFQIMQATGYFPKPAAQPDADSDSEPT